MAPRCLAPATSAAGGEAGDGEQGGPVQKFAGIDCFDIEMNELDPDKLVEHIAALEPTFGGINLKTSRRRNASTSRRSCASG